MRALVIAVALTAAAALAGVAPSKVHAAPPSAVLIQLHVTSFCCPEFGTWEATGGASDSGTYVLTGGHLTGSIDPCFCVPPEHTAAFKEEFLLTSSQGTLTVKAEEQIVPTGDGSFPPSTGVWHIESGTGAYERASGHGTSAFRSTDLTLSLTGVISKVDL